MQIRNAEAGCQPKTRHYNNSHTVIHILPNYEQTDLKTAIVPLSILNHILASFILGQGHFHVKEGLLDEDSAQS